MEKKRIGFIGLGLMGNPMAARIIEAGHELFIFNRTVEKATDLIARGAVFCSTPRETAANCDIIFTMLTDSKVLEDVVSGEDGLLAGLKPGAVHIDCSTVLAKTTTTLFERYKAEARNFVHSPVLGSVPQATDGSLLMFPGGETDVIENCTPVLKLLCKSMWIFDHPSKSGNLKIALNSIIAGTISMLSQSMVFLQKAGVDNSVFLEVLSNSTLNSQTIQFKGNNMLDRNFTPRFTVQNLLKDSNYMAESCHSLDCRADIAESISQILRDAIALGHGDEDYSALIKAFESSANIEVKRKD
ncbi:MAG: NAD(P)-dependent oxidoreductase [Bacteroidetes bacterium]|nr:NAD(P)-dependent oxidoreductase [Bacteroidota bacterium]